MVFVHNKLKIFMVREKLQQYDNQPKHQPNQTPTKTPVLKNFLFNTSQGT